MSTMRRQKRRRPICSDIVNVFEFVVGLGRGRGGGEGTRHFGTTLKTLPSVLPGHLTYIYVKQFRTIFNFHEKVVERMWLTPYVATTRLFVSPGCS